MKDVGPKMVDESDFDGNPVMRQGERKWLPRES
jgi:hypothetical protein